MKLNKKGFTLVELLAVVVILLAITVMAISSISAAIERNKIKQNNTKIQVIISYAKLYYEDHKNTLGSSGCMSVSSLNLSENEITDADGKVFTGFVKYNINNNIFEYTESCS